MDADQILVLDARPHRRARHARELLAAAGSYARMWQLQQTEGGDAGSEAVESASVG